MEKSAAVLIADLLELPGSERAMMHLADLTASFERRVRYIVWKAGIPFGIATLAGQLVSYKISPAGYHPFGAFVAAMIGYFMVLLVVLVLDHRLQRRPLPSETPDLLREME